MGGRTIKGGAFLAGSLVGGFLWAKRAVDAANLPKDMQDAWRALMSVPALVPYVFFGLCFAVLVWSFWRDRHELKKPAGPFITTQADPNKHLRDDIERARLEAERMDAMSSVEFRRALDAYGRFESRAPKPLQAAEAWMDKNKPGAVNITSHGQQGGITAHTVNVAKPQPRVFGEAEKADLLRVVPRDEPITILAPMGDQEATHLATQIHAFLKAAGQRFAHDLVMVTPFAEPQTGIILQATRNGHDLIVGSNG